MYNKVVYFFIFFYLRIFVFMRIVGNLLKMRTELQSTVLYTLNLNEEKIFLNDLIGQKIGLKWLNEIECISCGNKTIKSFAQGFCYPCFVSVPEAAPCIIRPELCEAHKGIARDLEWSEKNCLTDHIVYLALTSGLKVGVTRSSQIPTRWMDQGAVRAIKFAKTPNRHIAGLIETDLKKHVADKTSWQKMLKNDVDLTINLIEEKYRIKLLLKDDKKDLFIEDDIITEINYPVDQYPTKVKSINLEKILEFEKVLVGIKGQYLLFEDETVINIRKYNGYKVEFSF